MDESTSEDESETETEDERQGAFGDDDLGTIQSILFGSQARESEARMADLETRLDTTSEESRSLIEERVHSSEENLRASLAHEVQEIWAAITAEQENRIASINELEQQHRKSTKELREAIDAAEQRAQSQRELVAESLERVAGQLRGDVHARATES